MKSRRIVAVATLLGAALVLGAAASRAAAQPPPVTHSVNLAALKASSVLVQKGAQTVPVAAAAATVQIAPWQYVVARREGGVARVEPMTAGSPDRPAWALPLTLVTVNAEGVQLELQPIVEAGDGLMMRGAGSAFTGALHVGVRNTVNPTGTETLGQPVQILVTGALGQISPQAVSVTHTNLPLVDVALEDPAPQEPVQLLVRASFVQEAFTIPVPVRRPRLVLEISPPSIQGFGVDTAVVSVRMEGVQDAAGRSVSLASTQGRLDPAPAVTLDALARQIPRLLASRRLRGRVPQARNGEREEVEGLVALAGGRCGVGPCARGGDRHRHQPAAVAADRDDERGAGVRRRSARDLPGSRQADNSAGQLGKTPNRRGEGGRPIPDCAGFLIHRQPAD